MPDEITSRAIDQLLLQAEEAQRKHDKTYEDDDFYRVCSLARRLRLSAMLLANGVRNFYWDKSYIVICERILLSPSGSFRFKKNTQANIPADYQWKKLHDEVKWVEKFVKVWCRDLWALDPEFGEAAWLDVWGLDQRKRQARSIHRNQESLLF